MTRTRAADAKRGEPVLDFATMLLACLTHWYVSLLYVVPVLAVGGWGWWSAKRSARRRAQRVPRPS